MLYLFTGNAHRLQMRNATMLIITVMIFVLATGNCLVALHMSLPLTSECGKLLLAWA